MILRRPYAFLIKNFKLIHLIFVLVTSYLMYRTYVLHSFFAEAVDVKIVVGQELTNSLFNTLMYVSILAVILLSIAIIWLLTFKKKKTLLYFLNLFFYIILAVLYYYTYSQVSIMEITAVDIRIIRIINDLLNITLVLQFISIAVYAIRATGFDIKKFNFGQDIVDLQIDVEDKEEFEVDFDLDINRVNKKFRRKLRFWKYVYVENKFLINIAVCLAIGLTGLFTLLYVDSNRRFVEKMLIQTTNYIINVDESYITTKDYQNKIIDDTKKLVIVKFDVQSRYEEKQELRLGMFELKIGEKKYYPLYDYYEKVIDMGVSYHDQVIDHNISTYILTYTVDKNDSLDDVLLNFYDGVNYGQSGNNSRIYKIKLEPTDLDNVTNNEAVNLGKAININNDFINNGKLKINGYQLNNRFPLNYQFCVTTNECLNSIEYLVPRVNSNVDKILLRIDGTWQMENKIEGLNNLYDLLRMYGSLIYKANGNQVEQRLNLGRIASSKMKENDIYYLEIPEETMRSETLVLNIGIRNNNYAYILK